DQGRRGHAARRGHRAARRGHAGDPLRPPRRPARRRQRRDPQEALQAPEGAARGALGLADRGEPPHGGRGVREAQASPAVIRLAVRVDRAHAELVLAELLELAPGGVEETELGDAVEYAIYGAPGEV